MTVYSYAQGEQIWINNGGPPAVAPIAAAIMVAESGGNSQAINPDDNGGTQTSWGLWQISNGTHNQPVPNILDPNINAQQAVAKFKAAGNQFTAWGTYNSGAYKADVNPSTTPDPNVPGPWSIPGASAADSFFARAAGGDDCALNIGGQHIGIVFGHGPTLPSTCLVRKTEIRAVIGAFMLVAGGFVLLPGVIVLAAFAFRASGAQSAAVQTASQLGPSGRVLKAAGRGAATRTGVTAAGRERRADLRSARQGP